MCTKPEIEDGCASFTGCSFDTSLVWSSTEAAPEFCPATSYSSCGNFISAFDDLYNGRDKSMFEAGSPMRIDETNPAMPDFSNTQFPTAFVQDVTQPHGIARINETCTDAGVCQSVYLYEYEPILSKSEDLFCNATLGPPSILAQACDASMDFLLGTKVSIGLLASTAKALNDCKYLVCLW